MDKSLWEKAKAGNKAAEDNLQAVDEHTHRITGVKKKRKRGKKK